jgi:cellulose synthase/poly-beta-1,6-N-acetylglucosamine synthase-like glycosyltransferase
MTAPADIVATLISLDGASFLAMFWFLIFFELPRYVLANVVIGLNAGRRSDPRPDDDAPGSVSVIVACHNSAAGMAKTARSLAEQTRCKLQIIVVDDGSVDDTARVGRQLQQQGVIDVLVSSGLRAGKSAALNLGLHYATGDIVASVDADTTFDRDSFRRVAACFADPRVGVAGANVGVRNPRASLLTAIQAVEYAISISLGRRVSTLLGILPIASGAFAAYRRDALQAVGGWEAGPGEDADVTLKLRRAGWSVAFISDAHALTDAPATLVPFFHQRVRWERDLLRLHLRKYRTLLMPWSRGFSLREAAGAADVLVFSIAPSFAFAGYAIWLLAGYGAAALQILVLAAIVYSLIGAATFVLATAVADRPGELRLLPFALGYGLYCVSLLYPVRLYAYVTELAFDRSYRSSFAPRKVLDSIGRF